MLLAILAAAILGVALRPVSSPQPCEMLHRKVLDVDPFLTYSRVAHREVAHCSSFMMNHLSPCLQGHLACKVTLLARFQKRKLLPYNISTRSLCPVPASTSSYPLHAHLSHTVSILPHFAPTLDPSRSLRVSSVSNPASEQIHPASFIIEIPRRFSSSTASVTSCYCLALF